MTIHRAFLSYASEETELASKLVQGFSSKGIKIWYAPIELKVGDKVLDSIERGMKESEYAILLISNNYLNKGWTKYEMDVLIRENIEKDRKILPIWHEVTKEQVEEKISGLAGIFALNSAIGAENLVGKLVEAMTNSAPLLGVIPSWESPKWRFLEGRGEIRLQTESGPVTTLWELLIHTPDNGYPLYFEGELYSKKELVARAAYLIPHIPDVAKGYVGEEGIKKIYDICIQNGEDPEKYA